MKRKLTVPFWGILLAALVVEGHAVQEQTASTLMIFDEDTAQCRRVVREYCAIVQDMAAEKETNPEKQEKALTLLRQARSLWSEVMNKWSDSPPPEYASDAAFKARLRDVANALEDMERALSAGDARRSFVACGFGCGLFVTMHEQNGLSYAVDSLFHLRKTMRSAGAAQKAHGIAKVRPMVGQALRQRDDVLTAPAPWPDGDERLAPYFEAIRELSRYTDEWALAVQANDLQAAQAAHKELLVQINRAYGLAL